MVTVVTVTWMDGKQETCRADRVWDDGSVLRIEQRQGITGRVSEVRSVPLCNVRSWTAEGG